MNLALSLVRTDRGRRFALAREVAAPAGAVWTVMSHTDRWPEWGPPVTGVDYEPGVVAPGTTGRVRAFGVVWVPFRIESVTDRAWTWTAAGLTPPADGHRVEDLGDGRSRAVLELPLWAPWYLPLCALALRNVAAVAVSE